MKTRAESKFQDYRKTNDGIMIADIGFKKQLHALDPELDVVWNWASSKWEVWRFPGQKSLVKKMSPSAFHMLTVQTKDRTFRELGADILIKLQQGDPTRYSLNELQNYFDTMDDNIRRAKEKTFRKLINDIGMDSFDYVRGVVKKQVPDKIQAKDKKFLLNFDVKQGKGKRMLYVPSQKQKVINAIAGGM